MSNSTEFVCKCKKTKGWVSDDGKATKPCPKCGRVYKGEYSLEKLGIEPIETRLAINPKTNESMYLTKKEKMPKGYRWF